ncbi:MAG: M1 family metallopeptidase [Verrucomicrobiales bacterium]|nr:M1 family metallopeptidase [Verrucomicrobiales bacterium]
MKTAPHKTLLIGALLTLVFISPAAVIGASFSPGARSAGDPYLTTLGNGGYDVQHYDLTINYDPTANTMVSQADLTIRATQDLSEFSLDLRGLPGATATLDGLAAGVVQQSDKLIVTPSVGIESNRVFHIVVQYSGRPRSITDADGTIEGWLRIGSGAFVVGEPAGAMGWYPNNNTPSDKATYAFHITVPTTHTALGNGELTSRIDLGDGTWTWNWRMDLPMASYLSTSTIGRFDYTNLVSTVASGASGKPLEFYNAFESALSSAEKAALTTAAARQEGIIRSMADQIGMPFPFDSHGVVLYRLSPGYSAIEIQTKTHFTSTPLHLPTLAHEIAHQWFGDGVGPDSWREVWFNEGWATWWEWHWDNRQNGNPISVQEQFANNLNSNTDPTRWNTPPAQLSNASQMFSNFPIYKRPAMMLEAFRQIVGNFTFFEVQRALIAEYAYRTITTAQFIDLAKRLARERSGFPDSHLAKLDDFFQQWLYGVGKPALIPTTFFQQLAPRLALRAAGNDQLEISWPPTELRLVLEQSNDATSADWTPVQASATQTSAGTQVIVPTPTGIRFFRLRQV